MPNWEGAGRSRSAAFRKIRPKILKRDNYECQWVEDGMKCLQYANEVDHKLNELSGGTDDESNLQSLCTKHHGIKSAREGAEAARKNRAALQEKFTFTQQRHPGLN